MKQIDFAFIVHPLTMDDFFKKFGFMRCLPQFLAKAVTSIFPPMIASYVSGISSSYNSTTGCFIGVMLTSEQMLQLPPEVSLRKIVAAGKKAAQAGAKIIGLGAMTAVVGDAGITVAQNLNIAVTTGNSYTVATALEGTYKAVELMGLDIERASVAVLGASGSIGSACARILARKANYLTLTARNISRLERLAEDILDDTGLAVKVTADVKEAVKKADVIIAVSGAAGSIIDPEDLKPGAVVCDVARPRDVSAKVAQKRDDVLIIEGGIVEIPGDVQINFDFGFPHGTAYACMAETMILALEKRFESFSLGRELHVSRIDEISTLADKHGFKLAGLRSFERPVSIETIQDIREKARLKSS